MKRKISMLLRVGVSVGILVFLVWKMRGNFHDIAATLVKTSPILFLLATLLFIINIVFVSTRLQLLFIAEGIRIPFGQVVELSFIGYFFNNFLPTAVGGDLVKVYYAHKTTRQMAKSFIAIFMDRFIGLFCFVFLAVAAVLFSRGKSGAEITKIVFVFALVSIAVLFVILNTAIAKVILARLSKFKLWDLGERLSKVYRAVHEYRNKKGVILIVTGISIVAQVIYFLTIYILVKSLDANLVLTTIFILMSIVSVISMLPSMGGLGLREGAIVAFFGPFIGNEKAFSVSILLFAVLLIVSLVGAFIYISAPQFRVKGEDLTKLEEYSA